MSDDHRVHYRPEAIGVLPPGFRLADRYRIIKHLAAGGFGITYLAEHEELKKRYAIKESFLREFSSRRGANVVPNTANGDLYAWGLKRFIEEAQKLALFKHPSIVDVVDVFRSNGTAYMVMSFEDGVPLIDWLGKRARPPAQAELDAIVGPLLDALEYIHAKNYLHRDIAPDNIIVRREGPPCLIDFGAARAAMAEHTRSLTAIVKPGYSPVEQYVTDGEGQGPWTDIYALAATLYRAVAGAKPPEAPDRSAKDRYAPASLMQAGDYRSGFLAAIDAGLRVRPDIRPQSISAWRPMLLGAPARAPTAATIREREPPPLPTLRPTPATPAPIVGQGVDPPPVPVGRPPQRRRPIEVILATLTIIGTFGIMLVFTWFPQRPLTVAKERALNPKDEFQECAKCPLMVVLPAGDFLMGSPPEEIDRKSDEGPRHRVTIPRAFAVGKFAVTFAEWDACVAEGGCQSRKVPSDQGWGRDRQPVINVSWSDAQEYVVWLNKTTGKNYRLLSETEWEYAARANSTTRFWWGDDIGRRRANCAGCGTQWDNKQTSPVGVFEANPFGLHDMNGNVWQWVQDCWNVSYNGAPVDGSPWTSGDCNSRVLRGGSWHSLPQFLRSAVRFGITTNFLDGDVGFRIARTLDIAPIQTLTSAPPIQARDRALTAVEERALRPNDEFQECDTCPRMVVLPAGRFNMGSPLEEKDRSSNEGPAHEVTIRQPFAVGKFEVTFAEWDACASDGGCQSNRSPSDQGWGRDKRPVINVSWNNAQEYVAWLKKKTGKQYRLLSEAEWEYAARATMTTRYWWGNDIGRNQANCDDCGSQWDNRQTAPIGSFAANSFGLHDMNGNMWEWVEDCWHDNYNGAPTEGSAWTTSCTDSRRRVLRGGSWGSFPRYLRSASRFDVSDYHWDSYIGFRVARTLAP